MSAKFVGALIGGLFWGWFSDRYERKPLGVGFALSAVAVFAYLKLARSPLAFAVFGFGRGFAMTAPLVTGAIAASFELGTAMS